MPREMMDLKPAAVVDWYKHAAGCADGGLEHAEGLAMQIYRAHGGEPFLLCTSMFLREWLRGMSVHACHPSPGPDALAGSCGGLLWVGGGGRVPYFFKEWIHSLGACGEG